MISIAYRMSEQKRRNIHYCLFAAICNRPTKSQSIPGDYWKQFTIQLISILLLITTDFHSLFLASATRIRVKPRSACVKKQKKNSNLLILFLSKVFACAAKSGNKIHRHPRTHTHKQGEQKMFANIIRPKNLRQTFYPMYCFMKCFGFFTARYKVMKFLIKYLFHFIQFLAFLRLFFAICVAFVSFSVQRPKCKVKWVK